jgi:hypothetical protein
VSRIYSELAVARMQVHEMSDQIRILRARVLQEPPAGWYEDVRDLLVRDAAVAVELVASGRSDGEAEDELERFAADCRRAGRNGPGPIRSRTETC